MDEMRIFIVYTDIPVSYTHLDVYKRQMLHCLTIRFWKISESETKTPQMNKSLPVSYTHLDVYKRQV